MLNCHQPGINNIRRELNFLRAERTVWREQVYEADERTNKETIKTRCTRAFCGLLDYSVRFLINLLIWTESLLVSALGDVLLQNFEDVERIDRWQRLGFKRRVLEQDGTIAALLEEFIGPVGKWYGAMSQMLGGVCDPFWLIAQEFKQSSIQWGVEFVMTIKRNANDDSCLVFYCEKEVTPIYRGITFFCPTWKWSWNKRIGQFGRSLIGHSPGKCKSNWQP